MSYIDVKLNEGTFQQEFVDALVQAGGANWSIEKTFYKVAIPTGSLASGIEKMKIARHDIIKNSAIEGSYLGIAMLSSRVVTKDDVPPEAIADIGANGDLDINDLIGWLDSFISENEENETIKFYNSSVIYFYMIERLPDVTNGSINLIFTKSNDLEKGCLDIEVTSSVCTKKTEKRQNAQGEWISTVSYETRFVDPQLDVMQSPISKVMTRFTKLEDFYNEDYKVPQSVTNWWADSKIAVRGFVGPDAITLVIQADTVPAWEDNIVPSIPLYYGRLEPFGDNYESIAFFAGTLPDTTLINAIPKYDYNDFSKNNFQDFINPLLKEYPRHPSNGINTVTIQRARQGARYQQYFLSWNAAPNSMPPDRENKHRSDFTNDMDRQYPRAWNHAESDEYKYWFNPSRYSGKIHTSKIYVMHPEEGLVGALYNVIGMSPIGIIGGKIKVLIDPCQEPMYQYYKYFVVDAISPLTTRPGTTYRPVGIGILDDTPII